MNDKNRHAARRWLWMGLPALALGVLLGWVAATRTERPNPAGAAAPAAEKKPLYWVAPMDPNFRSDKPGKSPMGMDLVPVYDEPAGDGDTVRISAAVENNLGVRTEPVRIRPLWRRIEAPAYVGFDETLISQVSIRTQGWITRLAINAKGERVRKGDLLFELYSPELVNAQKEYLQARRRDDSRLIAGGEEKLRALGMIRGEIESLARTGKVSENIRVVAPQDGVISALNVREGDFIQPNTIAMSLADLSSVWLQAEVFESQVEWVAEGQAAKATLDYLPGREFNGQVDYVYPILDPDTRTLRVRLRFDNPEEHLLPNMYAQVSIYGKLHPDALSVPRSALIRGMGKNRVVVALGDGKFQVQEVLAGMESGDYVEILAGLNAGDEVVTSAQFLLDSEASLAGAIKRLEAVPDHEPERRARLILTSGRVEAVDPARRHVRISHGPIDALAWPAMTMDFEVLDGVDLANVKPGEDVRMALKQQHAGEYAIARLSTGDEETEETVPAGEAATGTENHDHQDGARPEADAGSVQGTGVIRGVDRAEHTLRLEHDPIEALGWPSMTMRFGVADAVDLGKLETGQKVRFTLARPDGKTWVIQEIRPLKSGMAHGAQNHD